MTDEEKAEEYVNTHCCYQRQDFIRTYLDGLAEGRKENEALKSVCDFNCPVHKLATHNACLTCPAVRNSPHHDLKNVSDEELQKIIKDAEAEMEM